MKNGDRYYGGLPKEPSAAEYGDLIDSANKRLNEGDTTGVKLYHNNLGFRGYIARYKDYPRIEIHAKDNFPNPDTYSPYILHNGNYIHADHEFKSLDEVKAWIISPEVAKQIA